jgi:hypothetical protein
MENDVQLPVVNWKLTAASAAVSRRMFKQPPPKDEAQLVIQETFQSFNVPFPIFNQASFMRNFEARYPDDESNDPGWWAILN